MKAHVYYNSVAVHSCASQIRYKWTIKSYPTKTTHSIPKLHISWTVGQCLDFKSQKDAVPTEPQRTR